MPPGRRPISTEEERRIAEKEAIFRSMIDSGQTTTTFGRPGILDSIGKKLLSPVTEDMERYAEEQNNNQMQLEYQNSRLAPSRYYESLPDIKQAAYLDMLSNPPSADAMEGIREQRRIDTPGVYPTEQGAALNREKWGGQYQTTGQFEKPLFIVGDFTQDRIDETTPLSIDGDVFTFGNASGQSISNYLSTVIKNLKDDEGILIRSDNQSAGGLLGELKFGDAPLMVVTKRDGMVYQREINNEEAFEFQKSFITGYPAGYEQSKIDEISSRSMYPRTQFDKILDTLPQSEKAKLRQLSYLDLINKEGFVSTRDGIPGGAININNAERHIPSYYKDVPSDPEDPNSDYVYIHELGHVLSRGREGSQLARSDEFNDVQVNDVIESAKFKGKVYLENYGYYDTVLGEKGITEYGKSAETEDFAERFARYTIDKMGAPFAYDLETNEVISFAEVFPNTAAFFDKYFVTNPRRN